MAALTTYNTYKPSGIDWIGDIPSHWKAVALKHLVGIRITDGPHETPEFIEDGVPFVSAEAVKNGKVDFNFKRGCISQELDAIYSTKSKPKRGDIFIVKSGSTTGKVAYVDFDDNFNIWSPLALIRSKPEHSSFFLYHALASEYFQKTIQLFWSFGTQPNIGMNVLENLRVVVPPLSEQAAIASYLDEQTAQLDTLIDRKRRLIDLLREEKTALINETITKGINPNVPMKDSGIEWLGEIPAHWEVKKLKYVVKMLSGFAFSSDDFIPEGIQLLKIGNLYQNELQIDRQPTFLPSEFSEKYPDYVVGQGDILMSMTGTLGKRDYGYAVLIDSNVSFLLNQRVSKISVTGKCIKQFMIHSLRSEYFLNSLFTQPAGTKQGNFSNEQVLNQHITYPTNQIEQAQIIAKIDIEAAKIDHAVTRIEREIGLMQEYRTALISEVVTGKVKVV